jgi:Ser/Thr protein kinase RdoA (MazF antagonist)
VPFDPLISGEQARLAPEVRRLLRRLRDARLAEPRRAAATPADLGLQALPGGRNNQVFSWAATPGEPVCVKVYVVDQRRRADREWMALTALAAKGIGDVPRPLWRLDDPLMPVIGMTMLPGSSLSGLSDPVPAMGALPRLLRRLQELPLPAVRHLPRVDSAIHYIQRINDWAAQLLGRDPDALTIELSRLVSRWQCSDDQRLVGQPGLRRFSRGDGNLDNWLWDGRRLRVVDFEYCGYSDPVFDAADLVEHISARAIADAIWDEFASEIGVTGADAPRFAAARRTYALGWLAVLWKYRATRQEELEAQLERVRDLERTREAR